jgi:CubicO group peptidase (beta-lactamase class C family)
MTDFLSKLYLVFLVVCTCSCQNNIKTGTPESVGIHPDSISKAEGLMQQFIDDGKFAGISTAVLKDGKIVQRADFGFADIETHRTLESDAIFRIYSMTKPITAAGFMILFDEGKFELDDKVSDFIPEFASTKVYTPLGDSYELRPQRNELSIRHLLTHTGGIGYNGRDIPLIDSLYKSSIVKSNQLTLGEQVKLLSAIPLSFQPGTEWQYGYSIDVVGYLIEVLSGLPLDQFLKERLFNPLGMIDSEFYVQEEKVERLTEVHEIRDGKLIKISERDFTVPPSLFSGGGGLVSTMDDYIRFATMLLNGGTLLGKRVLSEHAVELMVTDQLPADFKHPNPNFRHGLAGIVEKDTGEYGWSGARSTYFRIDPQNNLLILTMTQFNPNTHHTYGVQFRNCIRNGITGLN